MSGYKSRRRLIAAVTLGALAVTGCATPISSPAPFPITAAPAPTAPSASQQTPTTPTTPRPAPTSTPRVVTFPSSGTPAQFGALVQDMTIDVIEIQSGTYRAWHMLIDVDRSARPLTVRPTPGAAVTWDGAGDGSSAGLFAFGSKGLTSDLTFVGPFTVQNYTLGSTGLVWTGYVRNLTLNGFVVRNITAAAEVNRHNAHVLYVSSDGTHRGTKIVANDWDVDLTASAHRVSGLHMYHAPPAVGVTALRWKVSGGYWGFVGRFDAADVTIDGWTITDCTVPFDSEGPAGVVRNVRATRSGAPIIRAPMQDGGGNSWQ